MALYGKTTLIQRISKAAKHGWTFQMVKDLIDSLWRDPGESHPPVTIADDSTDYLSIGDDQVLSINPCCNDQPVVPEGDVDGENDTFILPEVPNPYTVRVYRDGEGDALRLTPGVHYTLAGNIITTVIDIPNNIYPLYPGEQLLVFYDKFDSASEFIVEEYPTGDIDGVNKDFELTKIPDPTRMWVYKNPVHQRQGIKYTVLAAIISFIKAPFTSETVVVDYWGANEPDGIKYNVVPTGTIDGTNTDFTLPEIPTATMGYRNGARVLKTTNYTVAGPIISFIDPPNPGELLLFDITY